MFLCSSCDGVQESLPCKHDETTKEPFFVFPDCATITQISDSAGRKTLVDGEYGDCGDIVLNVLEDILGPSGADEFDAELTEADGRPICSYCASFPVGDNLLTAGLFCGCHQVWHRETVIHSKKEKCWIIAVRLQVARRLGNENGRTTEKSEMKEANVVHVRR